MADPLLLRPSALFAKLESVKGTPETIAAATDGAFNIFNPSMSEDTAFTERPAQAGFGRLRGVAGAMAGSLTFSLYLEPGTSGAIPAWASVFLPSCALINTGGVFARTGDTSLQKTATFVHYKGAGASSIKQTLCGAMGSCKIVYRNGQPHELQFSYKGKYWEETTATLLIPTLPTSLPPRGFQVLSLSGTPLLSPECTYDFAQNVKLLEGPNDANATGYSNAIVTDFRPTLATEPYQEALSVRDWRADFVGGVERPLSIIVGVANPITLASTAMQVAASPKFGNREQVYTRQLTINDNAGATLAFN